jgi:hypothetical protein
MAICAYKICVFLESLVNPRMLIQITHQRVTLKENSKNTTGISRLLSCLLEVVGREKTVIYQSKPKHGMSAKTGC